ncbi:MAG: hypothetical protein B1H11_10605 [Desulfobacteraceae bacterium 4484_190.1]|nr:MAG: hypothetical protein B1H11_10605 [Desulfobacteraceae bacterium 4484_190.1]
MSVYPDTAVRRAMKSQEIILHATRYEPGVNPLKTSKNRKAACLSADRSPRKRPAKRRVVFFQMVEGTPPSGNPASPVIARTSTQPPAVALSGIGSRYDAVFPRR